MSRVVQAKVGAYYGNGKPKSVEFWWGSARSDQRGWLYLDRTSTHFESGRLDSKPLGTPRHMGDARLDPE